MKYRHIPSGIIVNSEKELPKALYERIDAPKAEKKPAPRKRAASKSKEA